MLSKMRMYCWLATFVLALATVVLAVVVAIIMFVFLLGGSIDLSDVPIFVWGGVAWFLAWSTWLAGFSLDKLAGDPESMRGLAKRLADVTDKVAERTRKAASRDT